MREWESGRENSKFYSIHGMNNNNYYYYYRDGFKFREENKKLGKIDEKKSVVKEFIEKKKFKIEFFFSLPNFKCIKLLTKFELK